MIKLALWATLLAPAFAEAGPIDGDDAQHLAEALRYAGVKPTTVKTARTFHAATLSCTIDLDNALNEYRCTVDRREIKDAPAYLLSQAMDGVVGFESRIKGDSITTSGTNVACIVDPNKKPLDARFECTWDKMKPVPPKKPVKDIVQPVKGEKQ
ncbi:MAG: hypothetical protein H0V17_09815 [Deltaproteobacteria bacterium]|nr:hypothetical protein [Deltaproteobacteria bacterium]